MDEPCGPEKLLRGLTLLPCNRSPLQEVIVRRLSFCKKDVSPERGPLRNGNGIYREPSIIYDHKFLISREGDLKTYMFSEGKKEKVYNAHRIYFLLHFLLDGVTRDNNAYIFVN